MKYSGLRLYEGYLRKPKPCEYINTCRLCVGPWLDENSNECYIPGRRNVSLVCKRDEIPPKQN